LRPGSDTHTGPQRQILSIVIPAYNEERFIGRVLDRIEAVDLEPLGVSKQVVVVDDGSRDRTGEIARGRAGVVFRRLDRNSGKGRAVRAGLELATGDLVIIQDADLEYDPRDYVPMLRALLDGRGAVVYGSRYLGHGRYPKQSLAAYVGGRSLSIVAWICTGVWLTDTSTALKLCRRDLVQSLGLSTTGFELDQEITAKLLARGRRIVEVPVSYAPRSRREGKKIGLRDWFVGCRTLIRFRKG
jgi:glycosyltransferase involved in cell wall biosynthesis